MYNKERTLPYLYNIPINAHALVSERLYPSMDAAGVLVYMQQAVSLTEYQKFCIKEGDSVYFWFKHTNIIRALPLVFNEERTSLPKEERDINESKLYESYRKRLSNLIEELVTCGLIAKAPFSQLLGKTYYCFTQKHDRLIQKSTLGNNLPRVGTNLPSTWKDSSNNYLNNQLTKQSLEKSKISDEKISPDAALASNENKRFKLTGKTIFQIADELFYLYHGNKTFMVELLDNLKSNKIDYGNTEDIRAKRLLSFFKSWGYFWHEKNRKKKIPLEIELHNEIMGDIGKMIKSKALEPSPAAAPTHATTEEQTLVAAYKAGTLVLPKRR